MDYGVSYKMELPLIWDYILSWALLVSGSHVAESRYTEHRVSARLTIYKCVIPKKYILATLYTDFQPSITLAQSCRWR